MSYRYATLSDADLDAKILQLSDADEKLLVGGAVFVVAGEGRRLEYTKGSRPELLSLLTEALRERDRRAGINVDYAIRVVYP